MLCFDTSTFQNSSLHILHKADLDFLNCFIWEKCFLQKGSCKIQRPLQQLLIFSLSEKKWVESKDSKAVDGTNEEHLQVVLGTRQNSKANISNQEILLTT